MIEKLKVRRRDLLCAPSVRPNSPSSRVHPRRLRDAKRPEMIYRHTVNYRDALRRILTIASSFLTKFFARIPREVPQSVVRRTMNPAGAGDDGKSGSSATTVRETTTGGGEVDEESATRRPLSTLLVEPPPTAHGSQPARTDTPTVKSGGRRPRRSRVDPLVVDAPKIISEVGAMTSQS